MNFRKNTRTGSTFIDHLTLGLGRLLMSRATHPRQNFVECPPPPPGYPHGEWKYVRPYPHPPCVTFILTKTGGMSELHAHSRDSDAHSPSVTFHVKRMCIIMANWGEAHGECISSRVMHMVYIKCALFLQKWSNLAFTGDSII